MYDFFSSPISQASMVACVEEDNVFLASAFLKGDGKASGSDDVWYDWLKYALVASFLKSNILLTQKFGD